EGAHVFRLDYVIDEGAQLGHYAGILNLTDIALDTLRLRGKVSDFRRDSAQFSLTRRVETLDINKLAVLSERLDIGFDLFIGSSYVPVPCTGRLGSDGFAGSCTFGASSTSEIDFGLWRVPNSWRVYDLFVQRDTLYELLRPVPGRWGFSAVAQPKLGPLEGYYWPSQRPSATLPLLTTSIAPSGAGSWSALERAGLVTEFTLDEHEHVVHREDRRLILNTDAGRQLLLELDTAAVQADLRLSTLDRTVTANGIIYVVQGDSLTPLSTVPDGWYVRSSMRDSDHVYALMSR